MLVGWKVTTLSLDVASVRYRALLPILGLEDRGISGRLFADHAGCHLDGLDALVFVKSFTPADLELARTARQRGIPVVLELCDCIFVENYAGKSGPDAPAAVFLRMAELAQAIVVTTEPLREIVAAETGGRLPIDIVPDGVDSAAAQRRAAVVVQAAVAERAARLPPRAAPPAQRKPRLLKRVRNWLFPRPAVRSPAAPPKPAVPEPPTPCATSATAKRILWYGNHGAAHARFGMLDLLDIRDALEAIAREHDVVLVVVSDNEDKYRGHIAPLAIPSEYHPWSHATVDRELRRASVVVVPNSLELFSRCKSANRAVFSLQHGVPVIATRTAALEGLAECVVFDDFLHGLRRYLAAPELARDDVRRSRDVIERLFGLSAIAAAWTAVLESVVGQADRSATRPVPPARRSAVQAA